MPSEPQCVRCKTTECVKYYVIADDLENPRPYCKPCNDDLFMDAMIAIAKEKE